MGCRVLKNPWSLEKLQQYCQSQNLKVCDFTILYLKKEFILTLFKYLFLKST